MKEGEEAAIFIDAFPNLLAGWTVIEASSLVQMVQEGREVITPESETEELNWTLFAVAYPNEAVNKGVPCSKKNAS